MHPKYVKSRVYAVQLSSSLHRLRYFDHAVSRAPVRLSCAELPAANSCWCSSVKSALRSTAAGAPVRVARRDVRNETVDVYLHNRTFASDRICGGTPVVRLHQTGIASQIVTSSSIASVASNIHAMFMWCT